jgi:Cu+-exporting ATPase
MEGHQMVELQIGGMHCQACSKRVENALSQVPGVTSVHVNGATGNATIHLSLPINNSVLISAVEAAGYQATPVGPQGHRHEHSDSPWPLIIALVCAIPFVVMMAGMLFGYHVPIPAWIQWTLATIVQLFAGYGFYRDSYHALRGGAADMNVLIAMGTTAAWGMSTLSWLFGWGIPLYFESSVFIIVFILIGRWLESRFRRKASQAIRGLLELQPQVAHAERNGIFVDRNVEDVIVGDLLKILVGERVPVDGVVIEGEAEVDESMMTGESRPVRKIVGDKVFAGTLNNNGVLKIKAQGVGADTLLAHIVAMVSQAQNSKAPAQKLADKISSWFVPGVILLSILTFFGALLFGVGAQQGIVNAISVLVIACPCALGLATPIVIVVAAGLGAKLGILFKDAEVFEKVRSMKTLFVDKTGTLTSGAMNVEAVGTDELLSVAGSLERQLKHPLAQAIVGAAEKKGVSLVDVEAFKSYPGKGVEGKLGSKLCGLGSLAFAREKGIEFDRDRVENRVKGGGTPIVVWKDGIFLGFFVVTDHVRPHAFEMVRDLGEMGIHVAMLTGDREEAASEVADAVGIRDYYAALLPQDKLAAIEKAKSEGIVVGMVGDGINDAPSLAAADVGIALEASTDVALESASIAILGGNLMGVVDAVKLSQATHKKILENLFLAFIYNIIAIPLAAFGFLTPAIAAAAMALSSLSVVLNALRLRGLA